MKKRLISLTLAILMMVAMLSVTAQAATDVTGDFTDPNFRAYVVKNYGKSGKIYAEDLAAVKDIDVKGSAIKTMAGIEHFPALERLECSDNQLTTLDLSKNPALKTLVCSNVYLAELDISKNSELIHLTCYNTQLTALDVSKNPKLAELHFYLNRITELDVSKNLLLEVLDCSQQSLTKLDVSKNLKLKELYCKGNELTEINVSKNAVLKRLECGNNKLTTLDVSKNPALEILGCAQNQLMALDVSGNPALWHFSCETNSLTELDVSKNPELSSLYCGSNKLTSLEVSKNPKLTTLYCEANQLTALDVSKNPELELFYCRNNLLTKLDLTNNTKLSVLDCSNNYFPSTVAISGVSKWNHMNSGVDFFFNTQKPQSELIPSPWSVEDVQRAAELNLVPAYLDVNHTRATTRAEFCALAVALYEEVSRAPINVREKFADTADVNVQKMAALGVVLGVGNNKFDPDGTLTREQAAVMLARLSAVIGKPMAEKVATFADKDTVSDWAVTQVGQVQAAGIMSGVGENKFAPKDSYTREQSIVTMLRVYNFVK